MTEQTDHQVDKAVIRSSFQVTPGYGGGHVRELRVPDYVDTDERGVLRAVWK